MYNVMELIESIEIEMRDNIPTEVIHVKPSRIYPATIARIMEVRQGDHNLTEFISESDSIANAEAQALRCAMYLQSAQLINPLCLELAKKPVRSIGTLTELQARASALELARRWFTAALKMEMGKQINLRILRDDDYRLMPNLTSI